MSRFAAPAAARTPVARSAAPRGCELARSGPMCVGHDVAPADPTFAGGCGWLQAKLEVGTSDDPLEREADRIAECVMRGEAAPARHSVAPVAVSRALQQPANSNSWPAPSAVEAILATPGQPLAADARAFMEVRFGHSFAAVRVHDDACAAGAAAGIAARAFTVGQHVAFARGQYAPASAAGRRLLAHELAHVLQQTGGAPLVQRDAMESDPDIALILAAAARAQKAGDNQTKLTIAGAEIAYRLLGRFLSGASSVVSGIGFNPKIKGVKATRSDKGGHSIELGKDFVVGVNGDNLASRLQMLVDALRAASGAKPRQDFVFLMGKDPKGTGNPFYTFAERYYKSHLPDAVMVKDINTLRGTLDYIAKNVSTPIGDMYIVTHANEDGTVSFGLDDKDKDKHLTVTELRNALHPANDKDELPAVEGKIDRFTRIRIKGCDLGRTQEMVELIDQAFGGLGAVSAPTHEQGFAYEPGPARTAAKEAFENIADAFPMPPEVDPTLKGAQLAKAKALRQKALAERKKKVLAEQKARLPEVKLIADKAGMFEEFSGPMFQRPGRTLFTEGDLAPQVKTMYTHLPEKRQTALVKGLVAKDKRAPSVASSQGTFQQHGQRVDEKTTWRYTLIEPRTLAEAKQVFYKLIAADRQRPTALLPVARDVEDEMETLDFPIEGLVTVPGENKPQSQPFVYSTGPHPVDAKLLRMGKEVLPNPERYAWSVDRKHATDGKTTASVNAVRVVAYLHHESLRAEPDKGFTRPETDTRFTATSKFAPPDDGGKPGKTGSKP